MFYGLFTSNKSKEDVLESMSEKVVRNVSRNWGKDCFVGVVHKRGFRIYHHEAYIKNSFNKTAYGLVWQSGDETKVFYILISPFLSWRVYAGILSVCLALNYDTFGTLEYVFEVIKGFRAIAIIPLFLGLLSQMMPISYKKAKIDEMLKQVI